MKKYKPTVERVETMMLVKVLLPNFRRSSIGFLLSFNCVTTMYKAEKTVYIIIIQ